MSRLVTIVTLLAILLLANIFMAIVNFQGIPTGLVVEEVDVPLEVNQPILGANERHKFSTCVEHADGTITLVLQGEKSINAITVNPDDYPDANRIYCDGEFIAYE